MNKMQDKKFAALRAMDDLLDANAAELPSAAGSTARTALKGYVAALATHGSAQETSERAGKGVTAQLRAARTTLVNDHMTPISTIGAAEFPHTPEFAALKMPEANTRFARVAAAADGMANLADAHADVFVKAGLPQDFVASLRQAGQNLTAVIDARAAMVGTRIKAGVSVKSTLSAAAKQVKVLTAFVRVDTKSNPGLLAQWNSAKHVAKSGTPATPATPVTPVSAAVPTTTTEGGTAPHAATVA